MGLMGMRPNVGGRALAGACIVGALGCGRTVTTTRPDPTEAGARTDTAATDAQIVDVPPPEDVPPPPEDLPPPPEDVPPPSSIVHLAAGSGNACVVIADGTVRCWGGNFAGELGNDAMTWSARPVEVLGLSGAAET